MRKYVGDLLLTSQSDIDACWYVLAHPESNVIPSLGRTSRQSGVVLIVSLIMLLLLTLIATTAMQSTSLEEKMAGNMRDKNLAFQAAESALNAAEGMLLPVLPAVLPTFTAAGTGGFYASGSTIPTPTAILTDAFWAANPVAQYDASGLGNNIGKPSYIIEDLNAADCPGSAVGSLGCHYYRITVRATGVSENTVVILQSVFSTS
ncbi:MAG: hypothetical protein HOO92_11780 [Methylococcaceae bacterium]|nr:hypothetical protein [Methylococcaceae bacterium]